MVGWNHSLDGHEFEQASGVAEGQTDIITRHFVGENRILFLFKLLNSRYY